MNGLTDTLRTWVARETLGRVAQVVLDSLGFIDVGVLRLCGCIIRGEHKTAPGASEVLRRR